MDWNIIREMDDENGKPTCWAARIDSDEYGRFIWITKYGKSKYIVEYKNKYGDYEQLAKFSSLKAAKKYGNKI